LTLADLRAACASIDPDPIAALALDLVRIPSPPGRERRMAERMADALSDAGARVRLDAEFPDSPSVIAELGSGDGPCIQWHGHLDAIDVPHAPPERRADRLTGRGSADMKGPLAAMTEALRLLRAHGLPADGRLLVTLHGRHESGGNEPLHALIARGIHGDAVITAELGGGVELPVGGLGLTFWDIAVERTGGAIHETAAAPDTLDPVEVGRRVHAALAELRDRVARDDRAAGRTVDVDGPGPSLFIGRFAAGDYPNRLPVRAELSGTRRHDERSTLAEVAAELTALVERVRRETGAEIELVTRPVAEAFRVDPAATIVGAVRDAHRELTGTDLRLTRARVASNAVHFVTEAGVPAVGYGPDPGTNHSDAESIAVAELARIAGGLALASAHYLEREVTARRERVPA
jgi:acetylornithine deacetylase/succinyl-diaminopimelate desuccinylase-like protein